MKAFPSRLFARMPWIVVALAFVWSSVTIALRQKSDAHSGKTVIRLAHWQLETGVREGFAEAAAAYEKQHPHVKIVQQAIPESTYGQWLSTQLIGGTAPDIVEVGMLDYPLLVAFYNRYLVPLSPVVTQPNPYNAGTDLADVPLHGTFKNGMVHSFIPEVQEFMVIPLAMSSVRLFYNRTLLKKLTGMDTPPAEFRAFMEVVREIQSQKLPNGRPYMAFSISKYHFMRIEDSMAKPLSYGALRRIDFNRDGRFSNAEMFMGFVSGKVDFSDPAYRAQFKMVEQLTATFASGWAGLGRDEALFAFAQQRAVFAAVGIYEAAAIQDLSTGKFELGVMDFPTPAADDPDFGVAFEGPRYEKPEGNVPMGVTRSSKHPDIAVDFLLFLTSRAQNEKFNARLKWSPIVKGAATDPSVRVFEPNVSGVFTAFDPNIHGSTAIKWSQLYTLFLIQQLSYEEMARAFTKYYVNEGREDFREVLRNRRRSQLQGEQMLTAFRSDAMRAPAADSAADWIKYRAVIIRQAVVDRIVHEQGRVFTDPEGLKKETFYTYSPKALANAKARVNRHLSPPDPTP